MHIFQHQIDVLIYFGPVYGHWMYPFETSHGHLKNSFHGSKVVEESICRAISSQWRTMLHEYDDIPTAQEALNLLWRPSMRGQYPTNITICDENIKKLH